MSDESRLPAVVETGQLQRRINTPTVYAVPLSVAERPVTSALARRWKYLLFVGVVAFVAAAAGARMMAEYTWTHTAALMCSEPRPNADHRSLDIVTVQNMVKTRQAVEQLIERFKLTCVPLALERSIDTTLPQGGRAIFVSLRWRDRAEGEALLNALVANCVEAVTDRERDFAKQQYASCEQRAALSRDALATAQRALLEFSNKSEIVDVDGDLASLRDGIVALETAMRDQRHSQNVLLTQKQRGTSPLVGLAMNRAEMSQLHATLAERRSEIARIKGLRHQMGELTANVDTLRAARDEADAELHSMEQAIASPHAGVSVIQPAQLSLSPPTSNEKKLFVFGFIATALVLCAPMLIVELKGTKENQILDTARKFGLPVLASSATEGRSGRKPSQFREMDDDYSRLLALRLQQFSQVSGSVILFSAMDGDAMPAPMLHRLAECLSRRNHRVVVIALDPQYATDSAFAEVLLDRDGGGESSQGGLSGYLSLVHSDVELLTVRTTMPDIDYVLPGKTPLPREGFGTQRMTELINELRQRYTTVIISGPGMNRVVDLELVASRVDGIVLHAFGAKRIDPSASRELQHLMELGAPVLGVIG